MLLTVFYKIDIGDLPMPIRRCSSMLRCCWFPISDVYISLTLQMTVVNHVLVKSVSIKRQSSTYRLITGIENFVFVSAQDKNNERSINVLFCSIAILDPRVGHTMDVLSLFISALFHSDWLFYGESITYRCCSSRPCVIFLACMHLALFLALCLSPCNSLSSWCDTIVC